MCCAQRSAAPRTMPRQRCVLPLFLAPCTVWRRHRNSKDALGLFETHSSSAAVTCMFLFLHALLVSRLAGPFHTRRRMLLRPPAAIGCPNTRARAAKSDELYSSGASPCRPPTGPRAHACHNPRHHTTRFDPPSSTHTQPATQPTSSVPLALTMPSPPQSPGKTGPLPRPLPRPRPAHIAP